MTQNIFHQETFQKIAVKPGLTNFQSYSVMHFHPRYLFLDSVGMIWSIYFLWNHNWQLGLGAFLLGRMLGFITVMNLDVEAFAQTTWGKIGMLHTQPVNMLTQLFGLVLTIYGIWDHQMLAVLGGLSFVLLGHLSGWNKVNSSF